MKTVLMVAYNFPPVGGAGVQRTLKFVKYLRHYGWEPVVLTVANPSVPVLDPTLSDDVPPGVEVRVAKTFEPSYQAKQKVSSPGATSGTFSFTGVLKGMASQLLLPDLQVLWWPHCLRELDRLIRDLRPDCIFVSAPPFSSFIPAAVIASRSGIPLVLDYRDEWAFSRQQWENANKSAWAAVADRWFERYALARCSAVTAANGSYLTSLGAAYPRQMERKMSRVITNGYDEEDFCAVTQGAATSASSVTIVYAGTVWKVTSLKRIAAALTQLSGRSDLPSFRLEVFGRVVPAEMDALRSDGADAFVTIHGYCEHHEVVRRMHEADVLVISLANEPGAEKIITGKLFEYMATGKHILAVVPEGETAAIVANDYDNATIAGPDNVGQIAASFEAIFRNLDAIRLHRGNCPAKYLRRNLAGKLCGLLDELTNRGGR